MDGSIRGTVKVSKDTDRSLRTSLAQRGGKQGDLSTFIEDAVRWRVLQQTLAQTKARNAGVPLAEVESAVDEALAAVRIERFGSQR